MMPKTFSPEVTKALEASLKELRCECKGRLVVIESGGRKFDMSPSCRFAEFVYVARVTVQTLCPRCDQVQTTYLASKRSMSDNRMVPFKAADAQSMWMTPVVLQDGYLYTSH